MHITSSRPFYEKECLRHKEHYNAIVQTDLQESNRSDILH